MCTECATTPLFFYSSPPVTGSTRRVPQINPSWWLLHTKRYPGEQERKKNWSCTKRERLPYRFFPPLTLQMRENNSLGCNLSYMLYHKSKQSMQIIISDNKVEFRRFQSFFLVDLSLLQAFFHIYYVNKRRYENFQSKISAKFFIVEAIFFEKEGYI